MGRLDGRTAWVTGGGRGIGRAIALAMAREGAVVAVSSRTRDELESVTREIEAAGSRGLAVTADALDLEQTNAAARTILESFGRLDILVNNAGGVVVGSAGFAGLQPIGHDDQLFLDNLSLNLVSAFRATNAVLAQMRDRRHGRIINIGSGYAKRSGGGLAYTTAKHGWSATPARSRRRSPSTASRSTACARAGPTPGWSTGRCWARCGGPTRRRPRGGAREACRTGARARGARPHGRPARGRGIGRHHRSGDQRRRRIQGLARIRGCACARADPGGCPWSAAAATTAATTTKPPPPPPRRHRHRRCRRDHRGRRC